MAEVIKLYKKVGETPLECLIRFRQDHPQYKDSNMTYLGRLDPMAEGLLLVLVGDTRGKKQYLDLDKTYEFEILWGFDTDTYDVLGVPDKQSVAGKKIIDRLPTALRKIKDKKTQSYPPYSSRTVSGRSLFSWAREGKIDQIEVPTRSIKIFSLEHIHTRLISGEEVLKNIEARVVLVQGDFRQKEILKAWQDLLSDRLAEKFLISSLMADVSSGTYIRSLAHEMGKMLGGSALAYSIRRTRVGEYRL
jgi:tRNA pseudouridine55 synthase